MLKKATIYLWGFVIIFVVVGVIFAALGSTAAFSMADAFGPIFFGAIGLQILIGIIIPFFDKK